MKIIETGLLARGVAGTARAVYTFPTVLSLSNGSLLAACRAGSTKDCADETVELYHSFDEGRTWKEPRNPFTVPVVNGARGTLKSGYLTESGPGHIIAGSLWIDRETYPGKPLFNPETEGLLPTAVVLADSCDFGETWSPWRIVPMPEEIGPPSLTNPILKLSDNTLAMSIETNKHYEDRSKWNQRAVLFHSTDLGQTWTGPVTAAQDPTGRIFNWDQRAGVAPDGRIVTFLWTYDTETHTFLNIHRRISADGGRTWLRVEDLGFSDQGGHPAILPDGRVVLAWVDRFKTRSIRARLAPSVDAEFDPQSEVVIYTLDANIRKDTEARTEEHDTAADLVEMSLWTFGLPFAETLPDGDVFIVYYAGTEKRMDVHWARLRLK